MFAVNVPAGEGDLALTPNADITRQLAGIDYQMHDATDMALNAQQLAGFQMGDALLVALIVMLLVEQLFAYLASYHVRPLQEHHPMILAVLNLLLVRSGRGPACVAIGADAQHHSIGHRTRRLRNLSPPDFDDERLPAALIAAAAIALVAVVWYLYRRDTVELARAPRFGVVLLRLVALAGLSCSSSASSAAPRAKSFTIHKLPCSSMSAKAWASASTKTQPKPAAHESKPSSTRSPTARSLPTSAKRTT